MRTLHSTCLSRNADVSRRSRDRSFDRRYSRRVKTLSFSNRCSASTIQVGDDHKHLRLRRTVRDGGRAEAVHQR